MFIDQAKITVRSGKGGDGAVSFRREKFVPRGGPDGGDGGRGGDVILQAQERVHTLLRFRYERHFAAGNGNNGSGNNRSGKKGQDVTIFVPPGTVVYEEGSDEPLVDLSRPRMSVVLAHGGRGGRGNAHFTTPTRQTPRFAEKGVPGEDYSLRLELKLLADVGLIGLPNAGKSTLLARVSAATPKIADYPFTTLEPQLGVVGIEERSFVMADLPGLIEGAAQGKGRGTDFLRHAERCRVLLHIVDVSGGFAGETEPWESFLTINREVAEYGAGLEQLPMLVALNKVDQEMSELYLEDMERNLEQAGYRYFKISALTGEGVQPLLYAIDAIIREQEEAEAAALAEPAPLRVSIHRERRELDINLLDEGLWEVTGTQVERIMATAHLDSDEGIERLQRTLERTGVFAALKERGVKPGDRVMIRGVELEYTE